MNHIHLIKKTNQIQSSNKIYNSNITWATYKHYLFIFVVLGATFFMMSAAVEAGSDFDLPLPSTYDTKGEVIDVAVAGNYAYLADTELGLIVLDVSHPTSPKLKTSYKPSGTGLYMVTVAGNYAYVQDGMINDDGMGNILVLDITNPTSPTVVGRYDYIYRYLQSLYSANNFMVEGSYAYYVGFTHDGIRGLNILDVSNPTAPTFVGSYDISRYIGGIAVVGNYAYINSEKGLLIVDISNPTAPTLTGSYDIYGTGPLIVAGNYAYIGSTEYRGFEIVDISNPISPTLVGKYNDGNGAVRRLKLAGNYVYCLDIFDLQVVDIMDPTKPILIKKYGTLPFPMALAISDNYAYVACDTNSLVVIRMDATNDGATSNSAIEKQPEKSIPGFEGVMLLAILIIMYITKRKS